MSALLLTLLAAQAPAAGVVADGLREDVRLEVIVVAESCTSPRCLAARAERERVRFLFFARPADDDENAFELRLFDAERKASLRRRAVPARLGEVARELAGLAIAAPDARARVVVLDLDAEGEGPELALLFPAALFVAAGAAGTVGAVCGVNALVADGDLRAGGLTQREAFARYDDRDGAALCANLSWITAGLTGLLGGAVLAQQLGWSE